MKRYLHFLSLIFLIGFAACTSKNNQSPTTFKESNAKYKLYVNAYTSGLISTTSSIRLRFANDMVALNQVGKTAPSDIMVFEPAIEGSFTWEDQQTLLFTPKKWLPSGQYYKATANLKKVYPTIESDLATMDFDFKVLEQHFEVDIRGFREQSLTDLSELRLMGTIRTNDIAIPEHVEKMLGINQNGKKDFKITWEHSASNKTHHFVIEGIKRADKAGSELELSWNGAAIGLQKQVKSEKVKIPTDKFEIINVKVIGSETESDQYLLVQFSLPLLQVQNLDGLVSIENYENTDDYSGRSNFRYVIDGSELRAYPTRQVGGERTVRISAGIRSLNDKILEEAKEWKVIFVGSKPAVRLVGNGTIVPETEGLYFPFEAIKLKAIDIEIFKIYQNNVLRFLQTNDIGEGGYNEDYYYGNSLNYVGRIIAQKHISLTNLNPKSNSNGWVRYGLDLKDIIKEEEGAIYQIRIAFSKKDAVCDCVNSPEDEMIEADNEPKRNDDGELTSIYASRSYYDYDYSKRENPCYQDYYNSNRFVKRNILGSNLGIIAKRGKDQELFIAVSDLLTTKPVSNASVEIYDKVLQPIAKISTDNDGVAKTKTEYKPDIVVVTYNNQKGYLRLRDGEALSLSSFETSGTEDYKGLKGYIYGERGVWRPGDSLYLTFVLEDKRNEIPDNHPVTFELQDPQGNIQQKITTYKNVHGMYDFRTKTADNAPTGFWWASVNVGGASFGQSVRIETVKPNRLKIALDWGKDKLLSADKNLAGDLAVKWLHGAPASDVRTQIEVGLESEETKFESYKNYIFEDPSRKPIYTSPMTVFDGTVDKEGKARVTGTINLAQQPAGFMRASFTTRAYEKSGDISTDNFSMSYSPYSTYVGIKSPKGEMDKSLDLNIANNLELIVVDENGKPVGNRTLSVGVYKLKWTWWWDSEDNVTNFNSSQHVGAIETQNLTTDANGKIVWKYVPKEFGRYLLRAVDITSGHSTGDIFYTGTSWDSENFNDKQAPTMLAFTANKPEYKVGDEVVLKVPAGQTGRALLTLENGFSVLEYQWIPIKNENGVQTITFKAKENMSPTIYAHVMLLQPHSKAQNDLPIRSYGVLPIKIVNPKTKLEPLLAMADILTPNSSVKIKVAEKNKQAMTYTIAMVDEGLLDLTRFKTPDLWEHFYKKEALGVKTWDMFNSVLGAFQLDQILAIGGDAGLEDDGKKANRFKPVVRFIGPFHLPAGKTVEHVLKMPNYVGSVRTMIVAAEAGAYGKSEKTTPVRQPLMVLGTLPRVLSPGEQIKLPVTVFAMENHVKDVNVTIECNNLLNLTGSKSQTLKFDKVGDAIVNFDLTVAEGLGIAKVKIIAQSGKEKASYEVELEVRNPNPYSNKTEQMVLDNGKEWNLAIAPIGIKGTNQAKLEISSIPPIDLARRLEYLILYPYGCIEQTTSSVFPQLYVHHLTKLEPGAKAQIEENIRAAIQKMQDFQTGLGGFAYWPGGSDNSDWATSYAGHFLLEAKASGYAVPQKLLDNWKRYQSSAAKNWQGRTSNTATGYNYSQDVFMQTYRLYTLALAQQGDLAAMNRLLNSSLPIQALWRLAATYAIMGKIEVAKQLIKGQSMEMPQYCELTGTYGSDLRDEAMVLETLNLLKERKDAANLILQMSKKLSSNQWYATQTIAYSLMAIAKFVGDNKIGEPVAFSYQIGNKPKQDITLKEQPIAQYIIDIEDVNQRKIFVQNKSKAPLFASVVMSGQPALGDTEANASSLALNIIYQDLNGQKIDPTNIAQGTNFVAIVEIAHKGKIANYDELALHQVFPAGWEIVNTRMNDAYSNTGGSAFDYQDFRDDRVYTYFDLGIGKTNKYKFYLNAAYQGKFYMPNVSCSAMYNNSIYANTAGKWVSVSAGKTVL